METTLNQIRAKKPCKKGWAKLLASLGKTSVDDEPLSIITILESNGLGDALWCLQCVQGHDREIRLYAVWCARQVQHLMTDPRSVAALDVAERFANGEASGADLAVAEAAALEAPWAVASAATRVAASAVIRAAARNAQEKRLRELCAECAEADR